MSASLNKTSTTNELAREHNKAAADRALMAWIRSSIAMIGFGFGVSKLYDAFEKTNPDRVSDLFYSTHVVGESFIILGVLSLLAAVVQYWHTLNRISMDQFVYSQSRALPMITAIALLGIGLFAFIAILL